MSRWGVMGSKTYSKPSEVTAEGGRVLVDGPDHVDFALTPEAAHVTGGRLIDAAAKACGQSGDEVEDEGRSSPPATDDTP